MKVKDLDLNPWSPLDPKNLTTEQGRLALFLRNLPKPFRRMITGQDATGFEMLEEIDLSEAQRAHFVEAYGQYARLVSAVSRELARARREEQELELHRRALDDFLDIRLMSRPKRGGAPRKAPDSRADARLYLEVERVARELTAGFETFKRLRKPGFEGSRGEIRTQLVKDGYSVAEAQAIVNARKVSAAAKNLVAAQQRRKPAAVQAAYTRGRRILGKSA